MTLDERLAGLELAAIPIWVLDIERCKISWGNSLAVEVWRARDREDLLRRDISDMSETTRIRLRSLLEAHRQGRRPEENWTLYPNGNPVTLKLRFSAIDLDDGRAGLLVQGIDQQAQDPSLLRAIESLRHTSALVTLVDRNGTILFQNPATARAFGPTTPLRDWFADGSLMPRILSALDERHAFQGEVVARTQQGMRWHAVEVRPTKDPATGHDAALIHQSDITIIEQQRRQIRTLSAPIIEIGERVLAVAVIGELDADRSDDISHRLLPAITDRQATHVILDLTGVRTLDRASADHLTRLVLAVRLLGARPIVTGIRPGLASALVSTGADLAGITVLATLKEGLKVCMGNTTR